MIKLRAARRAGDAGVRESRADLRTAENEVALQVRQAYIQILISTLERQAMTLEIAGAEERLKEAMDAVSAGNVLEMAALTQKTSLLQAKYQLRRIQNQILDLSATLNSLMNLPIDEALSLEPIPTEAEMKIPSLNEYRTIGERENPEIQSAIEAVERAREGIGAAKADYIPQVSAFAQYTFQNGEPFLVQNDAAAGMRMTWSIFDWGKRSAAVGEKDAVLAQAEGNLRKVKQRVAVQVEKSYHDLELAREMISTAKATLNQAEETRRVGSDRLFVGVSLASDDWAAKAAEASAQANLLRADLDYLLARSALEVAAGMAPK